MKKTTWVFFFHKYGKFLSVLLDKKVERKPLFFLQVWIIYAFYVLFLIMIMSSNLSRKTLMCIYLQTNVHLQNQIYQLPIYLYQLYWSAIFLTFLTMNRMSEILTIIQPYRLLFLMGNSHQKVRISHFLIRLRQFDAKFLLSKKPQRKRNL